MSNQFQNSNTQKVYDLSERTAIFGEKMIDFIRTLSKDFVNQQLFGQAIRSATSIGANYMEADGAESKKDFKHKIGICKKESKETEHWLRMIAKANPDRIDECRLLWKEAHELTLIFSAIIRSDKNK